MNLPDLPKKYNRKEANITPDVMDWFFNYYPDDVTVEVKVDKNKVLPHQKIALQQVEDGTFKWKIPDQGKKNPWDFIVLKTKMVKPFVVTCVGRVCQAIGKDGEEFTFKV